MERAGYGPRVFVISACLLLFLRGPAFGQQTGEIRGVVADVSGSPLPGVAVTARSPSLQGQRLGASDRNGGFLLPVLPVGTYVLTFELEGFEKLTMTGQEVRLGFSSTISVVLKPAAVSREVTVVASNPLVDKIRADTSYLLTRGSLERATTQSRTIAEIVNLAPGVTGVRSNAVTGGADTDWIPGLTTASGLPSFRGEGNGANNWLVDGLSTRGVAYNDPGIRVNFDAWEEVQIISDGFAPALGDGVGGFVNIVTKSGGNELHGGLGGLLQPAWLRAERRVQMAAANVPETSLQQYFVNLGGPIVKDRLWFFLSDDFFADTDRTRDQAIGWLPVPGGRKRSATDNIFGKITWTPSEDHTLSLGGTYDRLLGQSGGTGIPATYTKTDYSRYSYRLNYRGILSPRTIVTAAWGQNRNGTGIEPLSGDYQTPPYYYLDIGQMTNNAQFGNRIVQKRTDLAIGLTNYLDLGRWGSHEIKAGGSFYEYSDRESYHWTGLGFDLWPGDGFDNGTGMNWRDAHTPSSMWESAVGEARNTTRGVGLYVEDNVVRGRFSVMAGLRSETQQVFNDLGAKAWGWGLGDFLQPRASVAWDITGDGLNVLKAGYGVYSMPISTSFLPFVNSRPLFARRVFSWIGPSDPSEAQLKDPANWQFRLSQDWPRVVDPELKPNKTSRLLLAFERQLGHSWAVKIRGVFSRARNLINPISVFDPEATAPPNMGPYAGLWLIKRVLTNFELKRRSYRGLEMELDGQIPGLLRLDASWTWSRATGTAPGDFFEATTWDFYFGGYYDGSLFGYHPLFPDDSPYKGFIDSLFQGLGGRGIGDEGWYGVLPGSVDHVVKIVGTWFAPYGISVSTDLEYLSGYHWEEKGWSTVAGFCATFPEGRGTRTTPAHAYVDIAVEKDVRLRQGPTLGFGLNAYNLLNSQRPVSFFKNGEVAAGVANPLFGQVWARQLPRWVQLKLVLKF
jgi:hypothetical protein